MAAGPSHPLASGRDNSTLPPVHHDHPASIKSRVMSISKKGTPATCQWRLLAPRSVGTTRAPHLASEASPDVKAPVPIVGASASRAQQHKNTNWSTRSDRTIYLANTFQFVIYGRDRFGEQSPGNDHINKPTT